MAEEFDVTLEGDYQLTNTYRDATRAERRRINRYKRDNEISDEQMFLLMMKRDLDNVPVERRNNADTSSKGMLVVAVLIFWNSMMAAMNGGEFNMYLWTIAIASFLLVIFVYYTGLLNPYKRAVRKVNKYLKDMPEVPSYEVWCQDHPLKG